VGNTEYHQLGFSGPLEWLANDLVQNRHGDFTLALEAMKNLGARLSDSGAGCNMNELLLFAVRT
jgi:hypothetical protein